MLHASTDPSVFLLSGGLGKEGAGGPQSTLAGIAGTANWAVVGLWIVLLWFIRGRVLERRASREAPVT